MTLRLWRALKPRLAAERMTTVYETLERPLSLRWRAWSGAASPSTATCCRACRASSRRAWRGSRPRSSSIAGAPFNLGSPKQLGDILFGQMGLPGGKKTATGAWSTSASVLDDLAAEGHELAARILDWRQLSKLKSTYADALPGFVNPQDRARAHVLRARRDDDRAPVVVASPTCRTFRCAPRKGARSAAPSSRRPGASCISADYSQIELRLLAHIADIPALKKAFADGLDIHAMTASEMFGVPVEGMPGEIRRRAKAINFGIIYGISAFGLANQLGIRARGGGRLHPQIFRALPRHPRLHGGDQEDPRAPDGYVTTIFGRKCHYPRINASNPSERAFNERAAINAPIQGSAADIIRRAMVRMDDGARHAPGSRRAHAAAGA